jgi:hypothetical protein
MKKIIFKTFAICIMASSWILFLTADVSAQTKSGDAKVCTKDGDINPNGAIAACTRLSKSGRYGDKNLAVIYRSRGQAYKTLKKYDAALADYNRALKYNSKYAFAYNSRGIIYSLRGADSTAISNFNTAIRLDPNFSGAFYNRGKSYGKLRQNQKALKDYTKAIQLKPKFAHAYGNRGAIHDRLGNREKAIKDYLKQYNLGSRPAWLVSALRVYGALPGSVSTKKQRLVPKKKKISAKKSGDLLVHNKNEFGLWQAERKEFKDGRVLCYASSFARSSTAGNAKNFWLQVSHFIKPKLTIGEVSVSPSGSFKRNSTVIVRVTDEEFTLSTKPSRAYTKSKLDDYDLVKLFLNGTKASSRGTLDGVGKFSATFNLRGFRDAYKEISKSCGVGESRLK